MYLSHTAVNVKDVFVLDASLCRAHKGLKALPYLENAGHIKWREKAERMGPYVAYSLRILIRYPSSSIPTDGGGEGSLIKIFAHF